MLTRRRAMIGQEEQNVREWRLLVDTTIEEETNLISEQLGQECEELDILLYSVGTDTNKTFSNKNAILILFSNVQKTDGFLGGIMNNAGTKRMVHISVKTDPFYRYEYGILNDVSGNPAKISSTNYMAIPGFTLDLDFTDKINRIEIAPQQCVFGVGTQLKIYGR